MNIHLAALPQLSFSQRCAAYCAFVEETLTVLFFLFVKFKHLNSLKHGRNWRIHMCSGVVATVCRQKRAEIDARQ
jgi:hypothetical protein